MKIELKNLKINLAFSEETLMFKADVYVDGVKCAYASNDGCGGCTSIHPYEGKRDLFRKANEYAESLPSKEYTFSNQTVKIKSTLELVIDDIVTKKADEKELLKLQKQIDRRAKTCIVWGVPNTGSYKYLPIFHKTSKMTIDMAYSNNNPMHKMILQKAIANVRTKLGKDEVIFNKNLQNI